MRSARSSLLSLNGDFAENSMRGCQTFQVPFLLAGFFDIITSEKMYPTAAKAN